MRSILLPVAVVGLSLSLSACGGNDADENNVVAEDVNAMLNPEQLPPAEPAANAAVETPAETPEPETPEPEAAKPTAPRPPAPAPAKPKPAETAEPRAPDPNCLPEHRAAGHC